MRDISDIYNSYSILPSLAMHMLRVASVSSVICDNFLLPLDKNKIIKSALLHDMGNIIKSDLSLFPDFLKPQGLAYWQNIKNNFILRYGNDENVATMQILKELNLDFALGEMLNNLQFSFLCDLKESNNFSLKILHYSDLRVSPLGVCSLDERLIELGKRYKNVLNKNQKEKKLSLICCAKYIEKEIFKHSKINPEDITEKTIIPLLNKLKNFPI